MSSSPPNFDGSKVVEAYNDQMHVLGFVLGLRLPGMIFSVKGKGCGPHRGK